MTEVKSNLAAEFALDEYLNATEVFVGKLGAHRASLRGADATLALLDEQTRAAKTELNAVHLEIGNRQRELEELYREIRKVKGLLAEEGQARDWQPEATA